ncbi:hypothetical protein PBI_EGAD_44 [Arthrobacter phage Egad]|nr:hypothetical protein PBI_EGAD_44 [Arthrobacter phage Egad]
MADLTVAEAAKEVQDAKKELQASEQEISKIEYEMFEAGRRHDLAKLRVEEAERVLLEVASE